jgi:hypothetical protein
MATVYKFQVSLPVTDTLPRNRFVNAFHMEHVTGGLIDADLEDMCGDVAALYQAHYGDATREVDVKAYDTDAVPNYPRAEVVVNAGAAWPMTTPRELALVLSFSGPNRGNRRERGRMYLSPHLVVSQASAIGLRPSQGIMDWALAWYTESNNSFPDLGGVDWKFGVWSKAGNSFRQSTQAWVNDDWDVQRRRGLRESTRVSADREG